MLDIATYDEADRAARVHCGHWATIRAMRPDFFAGQGFPTRIERLTELRYLFDAMSKWDSGPVLQEMGGALPEDVAEITAAVRSFVDLHRAVLDREPARIPLGTLTYQYLVARKVAAFPRHASVLDIGPGEGYQSFYLSRDASVETYSAVEVTQSLYMLQTLVGDRAFGGKFRNHAVDPQPYPALHFPALRADGAAPLSALTVEPQATARSHLFPWWKAHLAFETRYDVVMSNENICEMSTEAFAFYVGEIARRLSPDGVFLVHGIGKTLEPKTLNERFQILSAVGFRGFIQETTFKNGGRLHTPNLVLVPPGNTRHGEATETFTERRFDESDPVVRAVYGLDRPAGEITTHAALVDAVRESLGDY
ncbi:MAG: hypothetical protein RLO01_18505 [Thalassobaculaceae bacterium]